MDMIDKNISSLTKRLVSHLQRNPQEVVKGAEHAAANEPVHHAVVELRPLLPGDGSAHWRGTIKSP